MENWAIFMPRNDIIFIEIECYEYFTAQAFHVMNRVISDMVEKYEEETFSS